MKKVLSQQEIDAILGKARGQGEQPGSDHRTVELCDFRNAGQLSEQHARTMTSLYEDFARNVANSLGAYLRAHFELTLSSVELMPVKDFLASFQEAGYVAFLNLEPGGSAALLQIETSLAFPIIDVLLGGFGTPAPKSRELTEIDEDIMEGVAQVLCRQLEATWQPLGISVAIDRQQKASQVQSVYSPTEKLALLTFEAKINDTAGAVNISFPAALANAMLRGASGDARRHSQAATETLPPLRERVLDCRFDSSVGLVQLRVPIRDLVELRSGHVLNFGLSAKNPASFVLGGREFFKALPVRSGKRRAAELLHLAVAAYPSL